ncbi:MAG: GguC family protein [Novosphingobium sp.]|nr:GguC family protein [Novosphingobium sp.]
MSLRLLQHRAPDGTRSVVLADAGVAYVLLGVVQTTDLAHRAIAAGTSMVHEALACEKGAEIDLEHAFAADHFIAPIDHADPAHLQLTGTGLTHLGSTEGRDKMHREAAAAAHQTDSMRMFLEGLEGGKPAGGGIGQQPEWFYKGDGTQLVGPGQPLEMPCFAQDGGEEPELAGVYMIGPDGTPFRLGFALANEFSDHVTERHNYLWLAHSKLRCAAIGPELLIGETPADIRGTSRIVRDGKVLWEKPFLTGEDNMSHSIANLEHHHFKYDLFRRPGDVHVHFFGTATLSFSDGLRTQEGDVFEIAAAPFTLPCRNPLSRAPGDAAVPIKVRVL